ncbi:MAG: SUMF1/EgtB/PvdO family nonheme iron enzyme [Polyangiaceae bacterium]
MPGDAKSAPPASSDASARRSLKLAPRKPAAKRDRGCPEEMQRVADFCVDRWEVRTETLNGEPLSPFYPPDFRILNKIRKVWMLERPRVGPERARALPLPPLPVWQRQRFKVRAVSQPGVIPQGYMSYYMAKRACAAAGKRLCSDDEWQLACEGQGKTKFPYGPDYVAGRCNVFREFHPADVLHLDASSGHRDPRLNLVLENGNDPGLRDTGATKSCVSEWSGGGIYDMVGNLDEWVEDPRGRFRGGFYSRNTRSGCEAKVASHPAGYFDYSTGARCCADPR